MRTKRAAATALTAAAMAVLVGCQGGGGAGPTTTAATLPTSTAPAGRTGGPGRAVGLFERFDSCDALLTSLKEAATADVTAYGLNPAPTVYPADAPATTAAAAARDSSTAAAPAGSSGTNTQEADVDEGDVVENDGRYVYSVVDGRLRVVDVAQAAQVANVELPPGNAEMVLAHSRLAVVTSGYATFGDFAPNTRSIMPVRSGPTVISVFDVGDPANPKLLGRTDLEGSSLGVRASDDVVRVVVRSSLGERLPFVSPASSNQRSSDKALTINKDAIAASTIDDWLPRSYEEAADGTTTEPAAALDCTQVGRPDVDHAGWAMTWVASVDLSGAPNAVGSAGVVADGSTVYAASDSLYVATPRVPSPAAGTDPAQIKAEDAATLVHAFSLAGTHAAYVASGEVRGWLLNQFSMSEQDGYLRVATTEDAGDLGSARSSSVRVLQRDGDKLVETGAVTGMGKGERIYAVRFAGPVGYVVTFRQTDPLYVLDLHDPAHPAQVGELQIPGYSSYLHPIGDGLLLGIGQAASGEGVVTGSKLSLFDVHDPAAPAELATLGLGTGASMAEYDHHAFLWWPDTRQAVVPVQSYEAYGRSGAHVIVVGTDTLAEQGVVYTDGNEPAGAPPIRSLVVNGELVTVTYNGVQLSSLETLQNRAWVTFH